MSGPQIGAVDAFQRRHTALGLPIAVVYKYFDDQATYLAVIITYYALFAVFPLLLLASSILGFVLQGNPELSEQVLDSALSQFPIIGDQFRRPEGLTGSTTTIIIGSLAALYGASGSARRSRTRSTSPGRSPATAGPTRSSCGCAAWSW